MIRQPSFLQFCHRNVIGLYLVSGLVIVSSLQVHLHATWGPSLTHASPRSPRSTRSADPHISIFMNIGGGGIRRYLTPVAVACLVHVSFTSRLDTDNSSLLGLPTTQLRRIKCIQNSAARAQLIMGIQARNQGWRGSGGDDRPPLFLCAAAECCCRNQGHARKRGDRPGTCIHLWPGCNGLGR